MKRITTLCFFFFLILSIYSHESIQGGIRFNLIAGQASGKGYWDWTSTHSEGRLYLLPGCGINATAQWDFSQQYSLETGLGIYLTQVGQKLDSTFYQYSQLTLEFPLLLKRSMANQNLSIALGPYLCLLPSPGHRNQSDQPIPLDWDSQSSMSGNKLLLGISLGGDYLIKQGAKGDFFLIFRFNHPFLAPEYHWEEQGSGAFRMNHLDLGLEYRWSGDRP